MRQLCMLSAAAAAQHATTDSSFVAVTVPETSCCIEEHLHQISVRCHHWMSLRSDRYSQWKYTSQHFS